MPKLWYWCINTRPGICSFLNKMPHLVQFHDADRFNLACLGTKTLYIVPKVLNPAHHRCMRYACQTGMPRKPDGPPCDPVCAHTGPQSRLPQTGGNTAGNCARQLPKVPLLAYTSTACPASGTTYLQTSPAFAPVTFLSSP